MTQLLDPYGRTIDYLRISITDHCNLDCLYCTPFGGRHRMKHSEILSYEEIRRVVEAAVKTGISKVRITGGEPLLRKKMVNLCRMLSNINGVENLAVTTNGLRLKELAHSLYDAGVRRINVSLDTLKPERFRKITGRDLLYRVLEGIQLAEKTGFHPIKINTVVMRGINADEIEDFARLTIRKPFHVRFIELMPTKGYSLENHNSLFMPVDKILKKVKNISELQIVPKTESFGPAKICSFPGAAGKVGFIAPLSHHFCHACNRLRLTADGKIRNCLFSENETDIKGPLRAGAPKEDLVNFFRQAAKTKPAKHKLSDLSDNIHLNQSLRTMRAIGG